MDSPLQRKIVSILTILREAEKPLGGTKIAQKLKEVGYDLSQRTARCHDHRHSRWLDNVNRSKRLTLQGLLTDLQQLKK
jgi:repressor of nif and glnA expression